MARKRNFALPFLLGAAGLLFISGAAHAQVAVYGTFNYTQDHDAGANESFSFFGGTAGAYDNFVHLGLMRAGVDLRGAFASGDQLHDRMILAGPRVAVRIPLLGFKPYGEFVAGVGGTSSQTPLEAGISSHPYSNKFTYAVIGGIDATLLPHLDLRVIEVGYGQQTGTYGSAASNPKTTLVSVNSGVVLRF